MSTKTNSLEEIKDILTSLRQGATSKRKFPKELWDSVIHLTHIHSFEEVCQYLQISPVYLKRKMSQSQKSTSIDFQEISMPATSPVDVVVIELNSNSGLRARIQGPLSCLDNLYILFKD